MNKHFHPRTVSPKRVTTQKMTQIPEKSGENKTPSKRKTREIATQTCESATKLLHKIVKKSNQGMVRHMEKPTKVNHKTTTYATVTRHWKKKDFLNYI